MQTPLELRIRIEDSHVHNVLQPSRALYDIFHMICEGHDGWVGWVGVLTNSQAAGVSEAKRKI